MEDSTNDIRILRDLARQVADIAAKDVQDERRQLWRRHNALERTRPLIYVRWFSVWHETIDLLLRCPGPFYRTYERLLLDKVYQDRLGDDVVVEPWIALRATYANDTGDRRWGPEIRHTPRTTERGSWQFDPPLKDESDFDSLVAPRHEIDEEATSAGLGRLQDAVGDIIEVCLDRGPFYRSDLSYDIAQLCGLEQLMWHMVDRPQWLHKVMAFLRDSVLRLHEQAEAAGDWRLCNHYNQAIPYAAGLPDPAADGAAVSRSRLWGWMASQETTLVSPEMFDEFILQYQLPILSAFGLTAYGCCEDLTRKIDLLRQIPNLRRIAVTPWADVRACAEQIGGDYVMSWRPSPAEMIATGFDPDRVRRLTRQGLQEAGDCHVDITLKDIETIGGKFEDLIEWTRIVRDVADES